MGVIFYKKRRLKLGRRPWRLSNAQIFYFACIVFISVTIMGLDYISRELTPVLMDMAQNEAEQAVMYAINYGLSNATLEQMEHDIDLSKENIIQNNADFFNVDYDRNGNVDSIIFDNAAIRDFLFNKSARIQTFMRLVENGTISIEHGSDRIIRINRKPIGTSASVPLGQATDMSLFGNLGPEIPIHFQPISDVETYIDPKIEEKGLNVVQIQLVIHVKVSVRIVMPFATKTSVIRQDLPVAEMTYTGDIPKYINGKPVDRTSKTPTNE
ncbi:sporulation protein YunB [Tuberibacillus calidus]|uniref:sporulation protein YunB n=1 Tax=Tuberibacillus calidus TaxID=340097 RepID=UPI0009D6C260|nr:sporulation protein YunB [Tuberibacillus calidus]